MYVSGGLVRMEYGSSDKHPVPIHCRMDNDGLSQTALYGMRSHWRCVKHKGL